MKTYTPPSNAPIITGTATVAADPVLSLLSANDTFYALTGSTPSPDPVSLFQILPRTFAATLQDSLVTGQTQGLPPPEEAQCEYRSTDNPSESAANKALRPHIHISALRIAGLEHAGYPVYHLVCTDLSELTELRRTTTLEKQKYDIIADITEDIPFEYDVATDTMAYAEKFHTLFGYPARIPHFRASLTQALHVDPLSDCFRVALVAMTVPPENVPECYACTADGTYRWFSLFCTRIEDETGVPLKAVGAIRNIDRQKREQLRLLDKSRIDAMTGLLNKTTTEEQIRDSLCDVRPGAMGALLMIDIDNFKNVNDTFGHLAGDAVITQLSRQFLRTFRREDIVGRVGGDEFHVFMRGITDLSAVREKASSICADVQKLFTNGELDNLVSISIGVSCAETPLSYGELSRQADVALYHAKAEGKNRYTFFGCTSADEGTDYRCAISPLVTPITRNSIVVDIIDTLFSQHNIRKGIDKALEFIGQALNVDGVLIYEKSLDFKTISITHEWTSRVEWACTSLFQNIPLENCHLPSPAVPGGIYYCNDLHALPPEEQTFSKDPSVTSLLQCDIVRDGMVVGLISFEERGTTRIWTQQEIDTLILMSKLISGHISQKQSARLLRQSNEATRDILDSLTETFVCVISKASYNLLYFNNCVVEHFPHAELGMTCYQLFKNRDLPCEACPQQRFSDEDTYCTLLHDVPFGKMALLSVSSILWENSEAAYVALISKHKPTSEEYKLQQKKEAYIHALCTTYDHVVDVDCTNGQYELLALAKRTQESFPETGDFNVMHRVVGEVSVLPEYRDVFLNQFDIEGMRKTFAGGASIAELEYQWQEKGRSYWRIRTALPYTQGDGSPHILIYLRDNTEQKAKECRAKAQQANYLLALQNNYSEIFHIDLAARTVTPLFYNSEQVAIAAEATDFATFFAERAHNRVHPGSLDAVLRFYKTDYIRDSLDKDDTVELEYRKRQTTDGDYRWIVATIRPVPDNPNDALLLLRDVTRSREKAQASRRLEQRYNTVFRQSYDVLTEVNLDTGVFTRLCFTEDPHTFPTQGKFKDVFELLRQRLAPDDREALTQRSLEALRAAFEQGTECPPLQYRMNTDGVWFWIESRAFFLRDADGERTVFFLARNIDAEKKREEERNLDAQRFTIALRDTYTEIHELDIDTNTTKLLFSNSERLYPVGVEGLVATQAIIENVIHPADRQHVAVVFAGANLRAAFEQGCPEVTAEFRRLGRDGAYHWVSVVIVPLREVNGMGSKTMLLLKDISQRKAQEQQQRRAEQYNLALRNIYDELYECNLTQDTYYRVYHEGDNYLSPPEKGSLNATIAMVAENMIHPEDRKRFLAFFDFFTLRENVVNGQHYSIGEFRRINQKGVYLWVAMTLFPVAVGEGEDETYLLFNMDIDARKKAEDITQQNRLLERQRFADERYRIIVEQTNTLVFEWWPESSARYLSPDIVQRFAGTYDNRDILRIWQEDQVIHPDDMPAFEDFLLHCRTRKHTEMTVRFRRQDNSFIWCKVVLSCLRDEWARPYRYIGTLNDVDSATCSALALQYRAEYDTLTGVYNMQTFHTRAAQLLRENPDRSYSIIRMDIDRFKVINDLYGMEEGDLLLKTIARLLSERMSPHSVCGHFSGDIFCACVDFSEEHLLDFVNELTIHLADYPLTSRVVPSFGICKVDTIDTPINVLCDWANLALKTVKGNVLICYAFYDGTLRNRILDEKKIETEMYESLLQNEFSVYLQPKVHIPTSRVVGSEGLVRWRHPTEGIIPPDRFIPLFEKNGFIIRLDEYIWEQTCKILRDWLDRGLTPTPISVNVSRMHIHDTRMCEKLLALIKKYDLPPELLELELTESVFLDSESQLFDSIRELKDCGFLLSLDDFGAGYSSLNMLKSLPIKTVKIDRGFLNEVVATERGKTIIRHTIALALDLHMEVIAEGVENRAQAAFLLDAGCFVAQGFYYSPPVPLAIFEKMAFGNICPFPLAPAPEQK